jgi:hypothetical protein
LWPDLRPATIALDEDAEDAVEIKGSRGHIVRVDDTRLDGVNPARVRAALDFAVRAHGDQKYGTEPYRVHLEEVMRGCTRMGFVADIFQMAAALHDVIEDTPVDRTGLQAKFGPEVARVVAELSHARGVETVDYLAAMSDTAFSVKLADRLANVERMGLLENSPDRAAYLLAKYGPEMPLFAAEAQKRGLMAPFAILDAAMAKTTTAIKGAVSEYELQQGLERAEAKRLARQKGLAGENADGTSSGGAFVSAMAGQKPVSSSSPLFVGRWPDLV